MSGRGGRGGKRPLIGGAAGRATSAAKATRVGASSVAPTEQDRCADDERHATARQAAAAAFAAPVVTHPVGDAPPPGRAPTLSSPAPPVALSGGALLGTEGSEMQPMVEFSAPPLAPIYDTSFFPFSPSMAAAAGMPSSMGFYGMPNMSMVPGMQGYSAPFPGTPAPFPSMPVATAPMQLFGESSQQHAVGSFAAMAASVNAGQGGNSAAAAAVPTAPVTAAAVGRGQTSIVSTPAATIRTVGAVAPVDDAAVAASLAVEVMAAAASPEAGPTGTATGVGTGAGPSSTTPPTSSPPRGPGSRAPLLTSPTTPSTVERPTTPPAFVRAGRRTGPPRPRVTSSPAAGPGAPAPGSADVAPPLMTAAAAYTPSAAAPSGPVPRTANLSAHSRHASRGHASGSASGGAAPTQAPARRAPRGRASAAVSGGSVGDTAGPMAAATLRAASAAAPLAAHPSPTPPPLRSRSASRGRAAGAGGPGGADGELPAAIDAEAVVEGVSGTEIMRVLSGMTRMVGTLADAVKSIGNKVQTQGLAMQNLGVQVGRIQEAAPVTVASPTRRLFRGFVDTDGEYSEDAELKDICGVTLTGGAPLLSDAQMRLVATGKVVSRKQQGTLKMLSIRRRVKSRYFGHVGGATITNDVVPDTDADWEMLMEETMSDLDVDAPEAYDFLTSDISSPAKRKRAAGSKAKGKAKGKGKGKAKRKSTCAAGGSNSGSGSSSDSVANSSSDDEVGGTKKAGAATTAGAAKKKQGDQVIRAYQPMTQSISHVLEAIKKRIVPVWFATVGSSAKSMQKQAASTWLENMNKLPEDEDEITQEQRNAPVRPRFICSDDGHDGIVAAVKEMFIHLGVADRIRLPAGLGNKEIAYTTTGHIALAATFVRAELEQIAAGVRRKRRGKDNGWYDRWRWEVITVHALMPTTTQPWRGFVITDANSPTRVDFEHPPVPVNAMRTRTVRARPAAPQASAPAKEVVTVGAVDGGAPVVRPRATSETGPDGVADASTMRTATAAPATEATATAAAAGDMVDDTTA